MEKITEVTCRTLKYGNYKTERRDLSKKELFQITALQSLFAMLTHIHCRIFDSIEFEGINFDKLPSATGTIRIRELEYEARACMNTWKTEFPEQFEMKKTVFTIKNFNDLVQVVFQNLSKWG